MARRQTFDIVQAAIRNHNLELEITHSHEEEDGEEIGMDGKVSDFNRLCDLLTRAGVSVAASSSVNCGPDSSVRGLSLSISK